jgi:DNA-binding response OmpR family regulator
MKTETDLGHQYAGTVSAIREVSRLRHEPQGRVLVIADNRAIRDALSILAGIEGCEVKVTTERAAIEELAKTWQPDLILFDLADPGSESSQLVRRCRELVGREVPVVVLADDPIAEDRVSAIGAAAILTKPFAVEELLGLLARFGHCSEDG